MTNTILHVEDEENDVLLFGHAMAQAGIVNPVQVVSDGQEAINYFNGVGESADRARFPLPLLILLDLKLPYVPGLEVLKWIRQRAHLSTPVIVLTSSENEADIATAYRLGANAYLVKPNEINRLVGVAKAIKEFWLCLNRYPAEAGPSPAGRSPETPSTG